MIGGTTALVAFFYKMKQHESKLQQSCVRWFRRTYPNHVLFAIPNGGHRNVKTASRLKAEGVLAGVPDLFIASHNFYYKGLFIEMKYGKGKQTTSQIEVGQMLRDNDYEVRVCRTFEEFQQVVLEYLKR